MFSCIARIRYLGRAARNSDSVCLLIRGPQLPLGAQRLEAFTHFTAAYMAESDKIRNPHARSKFPVVLAELSEQGHPFPGFPNVRRCLIPNLLGSWVDVEHGEDSMHYKFNTRHAIAKLICYLWEQVCGWPVTVARVRARLRSRVTARATLTCHRL